MSEKQGDGSRAGLNRTPAKMSTGFRRPGLLIASCVALACGDDTGTIGPAPPAPPPGATLRLPLRVHLLSSRLGPIDATFRDDALQALIVRVNQVWLQADIVWEIESITREPAQAEDQVEAALLAGVPLSANLILAILPQDRLFAEGWDAFLVRDLASAAGSPGVYFPDLPAAVSSEVDPAGVGDPGRILAHELGHSLMLLHVACTAGGNLMAANCDSQDRTRLSAAQIDQARRQAQTGGPARF